MNALQFESDIDFYNSRLTREQLLARAIVDAEAPTDILLLGELCKVLCNQF